MTPAPTPASEAGTPLVDALIESMLNGDGIPRCKEWENLEAFARDLERRLRAAEQLLENERNKVAGCSTAAFGYWKEGDWLHPDYECAAIHDVAKLYARMVEAERRLAAAEQERDDWKEDREQLRRDFFSERNRAETAERQFAEERASVENQAKDRP